MLVLCWTWWLNCSLPFKLHRFFCQGKETWTRFWEWLWCSFSWKGAVHLVEQSLKIFLTEAHLGSWRVLFCGSGQDSEIFQYCLFLNNLWIAEVDLEAWGFYILVQLTEGMRWFSSWRCVLWPWVWLSVSLLLDPILPQSLAALISPLHNVR